MHEAFSKMAIIVNYIELTCVIYLRIASSGATELGIVHLHINVYMYVCIYLYTFTCKYVLYFTDQKTYILSQEIVYEMALHVLVQRCVSMTSEAPEIPVFAGGGRETRPHCSLH